MSNSRTINSIKNIAASISYQVIALLLSFINRTVFIQVLGVGYLGINGLFNDVLSMLNMAELGFGTAMTFSMYKPLAEKDYDRLTGLTNFYKKVYRIIAISISGIGILLIPFLPYLVNLEHEVDHLVLYYLLFLASDIASYLVVYKTTILYADQKNYVLIKYSAYWSVAQTLSMTAILFFTHNYILYLVAQVLFVYGRNFHQSRIAERQYPFIKRKISLPSSETKNIFKDISSAFIYKISNVLLTATDNTLTSILVSTEMVGYYSNYYMVVAKITGILGTIFSSLIASIGNLMTTENAEKRYSIYRTMQSLSLMISTFCVTCIFFLEEDLIRVWLGEKFVLGTSVLGTICFNVNLVFWMLPIVSFREAAGLFRKTKYLMLCTAGLNIALSVILGMRFGLTGILAATSISKLLTIFWYEPKILFQNYFGRPMALFFAEIAKGALATAIVMVVTYITTSWFVPSSWMQLIVKSCFVGTIALISTLVLYYRSPGVKYILERVKMVAQRFGKQKVQ